MFTPRRVVELFEAMDPASLYRTGVARLADPALLDHPVLDRARVTALLARRPLDHPRLELVYERDGFHVYHRRGSLAPVRVVPEGRATEDGAEALASLASGALDPLRVTLLAPGSAPGNGSAGGAGWRPGRIAAVLREGNRLEVRVEDTSGGWLVMQDAWYPGWKATVNGEDAELVRADHAFRAVRIPAGDSVTVRTVFEPWSHRLGLLATVLGLLGAVALQRRRSRA